MNRDRQRHSDAEIQLQIEDVLKTAALLDIGEFDVFRIAYVQWHGRNPSDALLEPFFARYLFDSVVPVWVRHFARTVLQLANEGRLDPEQFGIKKLLASPEMVSRGMRYMVIIITVLGALFTLAIFTAQVLLPNCYFPPCY